MGRKGIPDRWLDYKPVGSCIEGTKIVAFKVPLKLTLCRSHLEEKEWFTPKELLEQQPNLKTIIDLTNTHRYYNPREEFGTKGIDHVKILVEGRGSIPQDFQLRRFFDAMDHHMEKYADKTDALVGVHCTHGLNRTGYFVCRYMVERLKFKPADAINSFNVARGHDMERQTLIDHLHLKELPEQYRSPLEDDAFDDGYRRRYGVREPRRHHPRDHRRRPGRADLDRKWRDRSRSERR